MHKSLMGRGVTLKDYINKVQEEEGSTTIVLSPPVWNRDELLLAVYTLYDGCKYHESDEHASLKKLEHFINSVVF
jgi:hypothetical protein